MLKNILALPSGLELSAGHGGNALMRVKTTEAINGDGDLSPGSCIAACLEATIWTATDEALVQAGDVLSLHKIAENGNRNLYGVYTAEKPTRISANTYRITAYDNICKLDKPISAVLATMQDQFPIDMQTLVVAVAAFCNVEIENPEILQNKAYNVRAFYADGLTARQLMSWAAAANGLYLRATTTGKLQFAWYENPDLTTTVHRTEYYQGKLSYDDFQCPVVDCVQIRQSDGDAGAYYPTVDTPESLLAIQGNLLLTNTDNLILSNVAHVIYNQMQQLTPYTPCRLIMPERSDIRLGGRLSVQNADGEYITAYVMAKTIEAGQMTVECYGNASRDSSSSINNSSYKNLTGKMYELSASIEGLKSRASNMDGSFSELNQSVEGLSLAIQDANGRYITIKQTIDGLTVTGQDGTTLINGGSIKTDNLFLNRLYDKLTQTNYIEMLADGLNFVLGNSQAVGIGYDSNNRAEPYMIFGNGISFNSSAYGMIKKYPNGLWVGDSADRGESTITHGTGIFIDTVNHKLYKYINGGEPIELVDNSNVVAVFG